MTITLHIDRLVLDGIALPPAHAARVRIAAEAELTRLFAGEPIPQRLFAGGATPRIDAPQLALAPGETPRALGVRIARAVHGALGAPA